MSHALDRRLNELQTRPDPELVLGVDLALVKDDELAARVNDHPQVFTFNKFPARRRLQPILDRVAAEALLRRAAAPPNRPLPKPVAPTTEPAAKPVSKRAAKSVAPATTPPTPEPRTRSSSKRAARPVAPAAVVPEPEPPARAATAGTARRRRAT